MKKVILFLCYFFIVANSFSQTSIFKGVVRDNASNGTVPGASVIDLSSNNGVVTDEKGNFSLITSSGKHRFVCSYIGMKKDTVELDLKDGETLVHNFVLNEVSKMLDIVVISAGKFEQNIEDVTVSMEVIRPKLAESRNSRNITDVLEQVPGLTILDGEPQAMRRRAVMHEDAERCCPACD